MVKELKLSKEHPSKQCRWQPPLKDYFISMDNVFPYQSDFLIC